MAVSQSRGHLAFIVSILLAQQLRDSRLALSRLCCALVVVKLLIML